MQRMKTNEQLTNINSSSSKGSNNSRVPIDETTESFRNFIRRFKDSPNTKRAYTSWLGQFVGYSNREDVVTKTGAVVGDNTDKLLFDSNILKIENHVHHYFDYLDDVLHLAPKTRGSYFEAVKRFYKSNKIMLDGDAKEYVGGHVNRICHREHFLF